MSLSCPAYSLGRWKKLVAPWYVRTPRSSTLRPRKVPVKPSPASGPPGYDPTLDDNDWAPDAICGVLDEVGGCDCCCCAALDS